MGLSWRRLLLVFYLIAALWPVALALVDGPAALTRPLTDPHDYLHDVGRVTDLGSYLSTFNNHVIGEGAWTTHVGGHPPGMLGLLAILDRLGLGGPTWAAALCILGGAATVPAVLSVNRLLGGETLARRAAPFLSLAPLALWIATSADAFFAGVAAAGVCLLAHAAARHGWVSDPLAAGGGLLLGCTLFFSYGLVLLGLLAVAVVVVRGRLRPLLIGGLGVVAVFAVVAATGFNWFHGLSLASQRVHAGPGWQDRPGLYFVFADIAALAIAVGPAVIAGLPLLRRSRFAAAPAAVLIAVTLAIVSNLSKGETERIYLPFAVWLLPLAGLLPVRQTRRWLAVQAGIALLIASLLLLSW